MLEGTQGKILYGSFGYPGILVHESPVYIKMWPRIVGFAYNSLQALSVCCRDCLGCALAYYTCQHKYIPITFKQWLRDCALQVTDQDAYNVWVYTLAALYLCVLHLLPHWAMQLLVIRKNCLGLIYAKFDFDKPASVVIRLPKWMELISNVMKLEYNYLPGAVPNHIIASNGKSWLSRACLGQLHPSLFSQILAQCQSTWLMDEGPRWQMVKAKVHLDKDKTTETSERPTVIHIWICMTFLCCRGSPICSFCDHLDVVEITTYAELFRQTQMVAGWFWSFFEGLWWWDWVFSP